MKVGQPRARLDFVVATIDCVDICPFHPGGWQCRHGVSGNSPTSMVDVFVAAGTACLAAAVVLIGRALLHAAKQVAADQLALAEAYKRVVVNQAEVFKRQSAQLDTFREEVLARQAQLSERLDMLPGVIDLAFYAHRAILEEGIGDLKVLARNLHLEIGELREHVTQNITELSSTLATDRDATSQAQTPLLEPG